MQIADMIRKHDNRAAEQRTLLPSDSVSDAQICSSKRKATNKNELDQQW
jgi:hypothetical protein